MSLWVIRPPAPEPYIRLLAPEPQSYKNFNQLNLLLGKVQSIWSYAHYFKWSMGYWNHFVLLISQVHVLKKLPYFLKLLCGFYPVPNWQMHVKVNNEKN